VEWKIESYEDGIVFAQGTLQQTEQMFSTIVQVHIAIITEIRIKNLHNSRENF